jgi:uncharacterized protein
MVAYHLEVDPSELRAFCERHRIARLAVFGSAQRGELTPESDVDVLVEFEVEARVGLIALAGMELELSSMIGRRVDLRTPAELSRHFRADVVEHARVEYAAG